MFPYEIVIWKRGKRFVFRCETIEGAKEIFTEYSENFRIERHDENVKYFEKYLKFGILAGSRDGFIQIYAGVA